VVYVHGKVASEQTRKTLFETVRKQPGIRWVYDCTQIAEHKADLPDKAASRDSMRELISDDSWWELDR